ncbi:MAG TPA: TIM barrel protein [Candidatus Limnocylindria bacterium]
MRLQLGINTCFAVKRWPEADAWAAIVRNELGLTLVQHSFDLVDLYAAPDRVAGQASELRAAVAAHGLQLHSTFTGLAAYSSNLLLAPDAADRAAAEAWFRAAIAFTASVDAKATGGHVGCFSVNDWRDAQRHTELWAELRASLARLAEAAAAAGLDYLVLENLAVAREPSTMAMIRELLDDGRSGRVPVRLCLDVGHMCVPGTWGSDRDPYAWLRELGRWAPVIQFQQSDAEGDHHWPFTAAHNAAGRIAAERVIEALGEGGVEESALILEVIPPFEQDEASVLDDLRESVTYWRQALERHGVLAG